MMEINPVEQIQSELQKEWGFRNARNVGAWKRL